ncbi:MAG: hypothetical protein L3J78_00535 [Thermoplasmata archaeon]|nr:hypothetical protein [Thermoplasmata archaeon]
MEREVWTRVAMVLAILVLVALIVATPYLMGRPSPGLDSVPLLIIGMSRNESAFIVNLGAAVQAYRYDVVRLTTNGTAPTSNGTHAETDTYGYHVWIPANGSFSVHAYLVDQHRNYFEYNVTVHTVKDASGHTVMVFTFPFEKDNSQSEVRRTAPDEDFRWGIPFRGTLP